MAIMPKGGGGKPEEERTVTAGTSVIEVLPSSGKTMKKVTVNPTPSQSKTVSPSTSQQTVSPDSGKLLSSVIVNAMPSGALSDITVSSAGLITAQVGTSGYLASGTKKTKQLTTQAAKTWTPTTADQSIASGRYLTGKQTIKGDTNLLAANIKSGVSIFGVDGTLVEGINPSELGFTKYAVDDIIFSSDTDLGSAVTINHSLGEVPKLSILCTEESPGNFYITRLCLMGKESNNTGILSYVYYYNGSSTSAYIPNGQSISTDSISIKNTSGSKLAAGVTYKLLTFA